jgi:hypothetical protein
MHGIRNCVTYAAHTLKRFHYAECMYTKQLWGLNCTRGTVQKAFTWHGQIACVYCIFSVTQELSETRVVNPNIYVWIWDMLPAIFFWVLTRFHSSPDKFWSFDTFKWVSTLTSWSEVVDKLIVRSASKETHRLLWNPKVQYLVHNSPPLIPIHSQLNVVVTPTFL